jgi:hypothetical protein
MGQNGEIGVEAKTKVPYTECSGRSIVQGVDDEPTKGRRSTFEGV